MPDWTRIREEYITGDIGLRTLADKHGVSFNTLKAHAKREGWGESRREFRKQMMPAADDMPVPDTIPHDTIPHHTTPHHSDPLPTYVPAGEAKARVNKIFQASDATLDHVLLLLERAKSLYELRAAAAALRDIKEVQMIRAALDEEEQIARIAKLRAETKQQEDAVRAEPVEIVFVGRTKEAAQ